MTRIITPDELHMGDVFLCRGKSEISKLISWVGDSPYSHASLYNGERIIEAGVSGVVKTELEVARSEASGYEFIDVYRWANSDDRPDLAVVVERGNDYYEKEYGFQALHLMVIAVAVRRKVLSNLFESWIVAMLRPYIDGFVPDDPDRVVCSELVYRCFDEAKTTPRHKMRPVIEIQAPRNRAPDFNVSALGNELWQLWNSMNPSDADEDSSDVMGANPPGVMSAPEEEEIDEAEMARLQQRLADIRMGLHRDDSSVFDPDSDGYFTPNPQAVIPLDFETSPSFVKVGRLALK